MQHRYSEEELKKAVKESKSIRQALQKLGIVAAGGNYRTVKKYIKSFGIDTSHFTGQLWNKGKELPLKRPISDYLENKFPIQSHKLRLRLLREGVFEHQCSVCKNEVWLEEPIPLELDHINGNHLDNRLENLRLLCPNCHAQTETYRRRK